ncbi:MAG: hypothetical protein D6819_00425 [Gammaproteobacteria bacterium]|nr:MAG: hypothetical protein D6819_00425 [Gammaproteobacteria bacterium]
MDLLPRQALALFHLLFTGEEPALSRFWLEAKDRKPLEQTGLIRLERRGRTTHIVLTEKGWGWASAHLDAPLSRSKRATQVLRAVLSHLRQAIASGRLSLAELLTPPHEDIEEAVRRAYLEASGGSYRTRARLADLRRRLPHIPREALDAFLIERHKAGQLALYPLEDPLDLHPEDEEAAVIIAGERHHLLYMKERGW